MDDLADGLARLAQRQHGVIHLDQLRSAGLTRHQVAHLTSSGRLLRQAPRAFLVGGAPLTWHARVLAECLSASPEVVASHRTAATLWGLNGFDPSRMLHLTGPVEWRPRIRKDVRAHSAVDLSLCRPSWRQRVPVTGVGRTLLDLCGSEPNRAVALRAIDSARKQKLITWAELHLVLEEHARPGRRGVATLRGLLELRAGGDSESPLEDLVYDLLVRSGLPRPLRQYPVATPRGEFRLDMAYPPPLSVAIECKGKADHHTDAAFEADPVRENALALKDWLVLNFTHARYDTDPDGIVAEVAAALRRRAAA